MFLTVSALGILSGLLLRGLAERRDEGFRGVLPADQRNDLLVSQGVLRAGGGRRRLDRKYLAQHACNLIIQQNAHQYNTYRYSICTKTCFGVICTIFRGVLVILVFKTETSHGT